MTRQDVIDIMKDSISISMENTGTFMNITIYVDGEPIASADERLICID